METKTATFRLTVGASSSAATDNVATDKQQHQHHHRYHHNHHHQHYRRRHHHHHHHHYHHHDYHHHLPKSLVMRPVIVARSTESACSTCDGRQAALISLSGPACHHQAMMTPCRIT
jgi:hypothetical protein